MLASAYTKIADIVFSHKQASNVENRDVVTSSAPSLNNENVLEALLRELLKEIKSNGVVMEKGMAAMANDRSVTFRPANVNMDDANGEHKFEQRTTKICIIDSVENNGCKNKNQIHDVI